MPRSAIAAIILAGLLPTASIAQQAKLSVREFEELYEHLQPIRDEAWQNVPWQLSILAARDQAAKERKPIFMLVRSGHPLGCV